MFLPCVTQCVEILELTGKAGQVSTHSGPSNTLGKKNAMASPSEELTAMKSMSSAQLIDNFHHGCAATPNDDDFAKIINLATTDDQAKLEMWDMECAGNWNNLATDQKRPVVTGGHNGRWTVHMGNNCVFFVDAFTHPSVILKKVDIMRAYFECRMQERMKEIEEDEAMQRCQCAMMPVTYALLDAELIYSCDRCYHEFAPSADWWRCSEGFDFDLCQSCYCEEQGSLSMCDSDCDAQ